MNIFNSPWPIWSYLYILSLIVGNNILSTHSMEWLLRGYLHLNELVNVKEIHDRTKSWSDHSFQAGAAGPLLDRCFDLERLVHNAKHLKRYFALCDCILDVSI